MKKTRVCCEFSLFSDTEFPVEKITESLNLEPTIFYKNKRKFLENDSGFYEILETCWELRVDYQESLDINIQINQILDELESKVLIISELKRRYNLESSLNVSVEIYDNIYPAIHLELKTMKLLSSLETFIDIDII